MRGDSKNERKKQIQEDGIVTVDEVVPIAVIICTFVLQPTPTFRVPILHVGELGWNMLEVAVQDVIDVVDEEGSGRGCHDKHGDKHVG